MKRNVQPLALMLCIALATAAEAQVHELRVSLFTPATNDVNVGFETMAKALEQKSGGRLKLKMFHASQLGPPPRQYDLVRTGVADMAYHLHGLTSGRFPLTELVELPGVITTTGAAAGAALNDLHAEYLAAEHQGTRVLGFMVGASLPLMTTKLEVRTLADLKGRRFRHPGPSISASIAAVGAAPVAIQPGEVHDALAKGVVDGAVIGYTGASAFKLHDLIRHIAEINFGGVTFVAVMNPAAYDKLPLDLRKLIDEYSGTAGLAHWAPMFDVAEARNREPMVKAGVKMARLDAKDQAAYDALAQKVQETAIADLEKKGLPAKAYFAKLKQALARHANK